MNAQSVLLLADTDLLRLSPTVANGETGTLSFYAWDQTDGTQYGTETVNTRGGTTAYSTASATVSITVNDVNDAPTLVSGTSVSLTAIAEGTTSSGHITELCSVLFDYRHRYREWFCILGSCCSWDD